MRKIFTLIFCLMVISAELVMTQAMKSKITIGMIGKGAKGPVFIAAHSGANVAAKEIGSKISREVVINWQTPEKDDAEGQVRAIEELVQSRVDGIAIACSDETILTPAINSAVEKGIPVLCFDSDAPKSKRFAYYGADEVEFGRLLVKQLAAEIYGKGTIAVFGESKAGLNLHLRLKGIKDELKKYSKIILPAKNIYQNVTDAKKAVELVKQEQKAKPNIAGWIFQVSSPLLTKNALDWMPGSVKIVAAQAVQAELEYVKSGHVQCLVGINSFQLGYKSIDILLNKIVYDKEPESAYIYIPLTLVTKENVDEWSLNWRKWLIKDAVYR
jgi:ribose transport system substrate-binding protein